eukprot:3667816-Pyramimonas_sp.AAC.1
MCIRDRHGPLLHRQVLCVLCEHGSPSAAPDPGTTLRRNVPPQGAGQLRGIPTTTPGSSLSPAAIPGCVPPPSLRPQVVYGFGMPMGPFRLADLVGGDVSLKTGTILSGAFPERSYRTALVQGLNDAGRKGEATKKGFYQYDARRKASPDPDLQTFLQASRQYKAQGLARPGSPDLPAGGPLGQTKACCVSDVIDGCVTCVTPPPLVGRR